MFNSGFISSMNGDEDIYDNTIENIQLPSEFSYMKNLPKVLNQGSEQICVPCSLSAYFEYKISLLSKHIQNSKFDLYDIFNSRTIKTDGMSIKEAIDYTIHTGAKYSSGVIKANKYYAVKSIFALRHAIVTNGPCIICLPVYDEYNTEFWTPNDELKGYHAVAVVGYDDNGFIIRNSWGSDYGYNGYAHISNNDIKKSKEIWTIC